MLVYDGFHKAEGTQLWRRLVDIHKLTGSSARCTQWCFIGAAALLSRPDDVKAMCRVLFRREQQIEAISEALEGFTARFIKLKALPSTDREDLESQQHREDRDTETLKFAEEFAGFIGSIIIARDNSSPILNVTVADTDQGYGKVVRTISNPPELLSDVEALGERCRLACSHAGVSFNSKLEALIRIPEFITYHCAGIMPGLATALLYSGEEYPCSPEDVERDVEKGSGALYIDPRTSTPDMAGLTKSCQFSPPPTMIAGPGPSSGRNTSLSSQLRLFSPPTWRPYSAASRSLRAAVIHRVSPGDPKWAGRQNAQLREIGRQPLQSRYTHVVISTADVRCRLHRHVDVL